MNTATAIGIEGVSRPHFTSLSESPKGTSIIHSQIQPAMDQAGQANSQGYMLVTDEDCPKKQNVRGQITSLLHENKLVWVITQFPNGADKGIF